MINNFHPNNIQFTYETECNCKLAFLDVMLCGNGENIALRVYRKITYADVCLNWNSFSPHSWRRRTLKILTEHAYIVCSTTELLDTEVKHLDKVFVEKDNYPKWVIRQIFTLGKSSPPTIGTIEVPANDNGTVTKKAYVTSTLSRR